jgi:hypothetical protein
MLDQWIVNVGDVVVDKDECLGMVAKGGDEQDDEMMDVVRVGSVVLDDERTGGAVPFRTGTALVRCRRFTALTPKVRKVLMLMRPL